MHKISILIYAILFSSFQAETAFADTLSALPTEQILTAESLVQKLPANFQGILYNCEPLCRFLSIKVDKLWNPPLNKIKINIENPSWVSKSDALYPLLVESLPVQPFVPIKTERDKNNNPNEENVPIPPLVPYNYGYSLTLGMRVLSSKIQSNSVPQENVSPTSLIQSPTAQISIFRLKPIWFLHQWLQLRANYETDFAGSSELSTGIKINHSAKDMHVDILVMKDHGKWLLRMGQLATDYQTEVNLLNNYSFSETWTWLGMGYLYKRFQLTADYGLAVDLVEKQDLRGPLSGSSFYKISGRWCSETQETFDVKYGFCMGVSKKQSSLASELKSDFAMPGQLVVRTDETQLQLLLRFGDDFYL